MTHKKSENNQKKNICRLKRQSNRYIFVKNFKKSEEILAELIEIEPSNLEYHFRCIELATQLNTLDQIEEKYRRTNGVEPENLKLILLFIEIKKLKTHSPLPFSNEFSKEDIRQIRDLLSLDTVKALNLSKFKEDIGQQHQIEGSLLRIQRNPVISDDEITASNREIAIKNFKEVKKNPENTLEESILKNLEIQKDHYKEHYGWWFLYGSILEYMGRIGDAVIAWKKAFELNSESEFVVAILAELQASGLMIESQEFDYIALYESFDRFLVHGNYETHIKLYRYFFKRGEYEEALGAVKTLSDWMQKQQGEVSPEVEVLSLLSSYKVYEIQKNTAAKDIVFHQAESLIQGLVKTPMDAQRLILLGNYLKGFGFQNFSTQIYKAIVSSRQSSIDDVIKAAKSLFFLNAFKEASEALKVAYQNSYGHKRLRHVLVISDLKLKGIDVRSYFSKRRKGFSLLKKNDLLAGLHVFDELLKKYEGDSEVHGALGHIYTLLGQMEPAKFHNRVMHESDFYNVQTTLRFIHFLLSIGDLQGVKHQTKFLLAAEKSFQPTQKADLHWCLASCQFSQGVVEEAADSLQEALQIDPWNSFYLLLALRIHQQLNHVQDFNLKNIIFDLETIILKKGEEIRDERIFEKRSFAIKYGHFFLNQGYSSYSWLLAKTFYAAFGFHESVVDFLIQAGSSHNHHIVMTELMGLLKKDIQFSEVSVMIARIHGMNMKFDMMEEWVAIHEKSQKNSPYESSLFYLKALKSVLGRDPEPQKALVFLEGIIDSQKNILKIPIEVQILHAYTQTLTGQVRRGLETLESIARFQPSLFCYYFLIKSRSKFPEYGELHKEYSSRFFDWVPKNPLEQMMTEELNMVFGKLSNAGVRHLAS